ncbi:restriction endonuclease subunit S [Vibrio parahaemolyticus]|uniref:restriction endonuclease subunit S n=1 Tax=Vibrio parahaemolyticus TaxID=670 RepID=UPI0027E52414|nr:restriction endonuclease subunit S [Vibrio parahaemolyticus]EHU4958667.1 restriction endonuclease subunit S [Vibrio parahaemolyticus]EJG0893643.1 restriction endonuclease subunit S [Vibrio parahaemolyticus]EKA7388946.1 restriction endonuclease subunit S [Vibrio parahaemolyticus]ELA9320574.1 restriction endonuclease subunit S [Vibrio parahaemolyticus]WMN66166.1 restriction endonuclease subunit S [Vibrio parahaemolyticus]
MSFEYENLENLNIQLIDGDRGKNYPKQSEFQESGYCLFLSAKNVTKSGFQFSEKVYVSEERHNLLRAGKLERYDIVLTTRGTIGNVAFYDNSVLDDVVRVNSGMLILRANTTVWNPRFLYFLFTSKIIQEQISSLTSGSAVPQLPAKDLRKFLLPKVPMGVQNYIVKVIGDLSDKLKINDQTNQTLEEMAQAIFKSWFVDFDPVKAKMNGEQPEGMDAATASLFPEKLVESELGLIPEGWKVGDLSDLMDFNPKRTLKKGTVAPYLDMKNMPTSGHLALDIYDREMGSGTKFMNGDSLLARITPCLENGKTAYVDFLEDEQVGWGSTEYIVMRSKSDSYKYFSYYMARFEPFRKFAIQSMTGTSGRQRAQAQTVQTMPFAIPPISILEKFDEFVAPNMQMIKSHGSENRTLAALRDTLLPKLLSGEIELAEISKTIK